MQNTDFKAATDAMLKLGVSLRQLADGLGVPEARVYQARMNPAASGYRKPPQGWENALAELAKRRQGELGELLGEATPAVEVGAGDTQKPERRAAQGRSRALRLMGRRQISNLDRPVGPRAGSGLGGLHEVRSHRML